MIKIFIPTPLRKFTGDLSTVELQAGTITEAIQNLATRFPELDQYLFDPDRHIRKFVRIFVGDQDIYQLHGTNTTLKAGDEVSIIPAIAGGCALAGRNSNSNSNSIDEIKLLNSYLKAT